MQVSLLDLVARCTLLAQDAAKQAEPAAEAAKDAGPTATQALRDVVKGDATTLAKLADQGIAWIVDRGPGILAGLALLLVGWMIAAWARRIVISALVKAKIDLTLAKFFGNLARWTILIFALLTSAGTVGINTTGFAALIAASGLAIGLALQGNLGNLASGVLLLIFRPFKIGDAVIVAGQAGIIDGIDLFSTNLDTADNRRIIVPNGAIFSGVIENQTHHPRRCITVSLPISPAAAIGEVESALKAAADRVASATPGALRDPAPAVALAELAPAVLWAVTLWCETPRYAVVRQALLRELQESIGKAGIGPTPPLQLVRQIS